MKIYNLSETRESDPKLRAVVYGDPGVGKTYFAASAALVPELSPVLAVSVGGGLLTASEFEGIDAVDIKSMRDLEKICKMLRMGKEDVRKYKTVIFDDWSEATQTGLEECAKGRDDDAPQIQDYGYLTRELSKMMRWIRDSATMHVVFTAWAKTTYPKVDGRKESKLEQDPIRIQPAFPESLGLNVEGYFDLLWYFTRGESGERILVTRPIDNVIRAKTRGKRFQAALDKMGANGVIENPDFPKIFEAWKASGKKAKKGNAQ